MKTHGGLFGGGGDNETEFEEAHGGGGRYKYEQNPVVYMCESVIMKYVILSAN